MALPVDVVIFPPQNTLPSSENVEADTDAALTGLSIFAYVDASAVTTTLSVEHGTLTILPVGGTQVDGSGTDTVTLTGSAKQINATLAAVKNVIYHGSQDFFGADTLTVTTNDHYAWATGAQTDTDQVPINVGALQAGTPGNDTFTALPGNERIDAGGGIDTVSFNFKLTDATVSYAGNEVIIDGPGSHTLLTGFETFKFTDGTVNNNDGDPLVDDLFYYSHYHDVWNAHVDADQHYHQNGWHEGRDPNAFFSTSLYLATNPDVKAAGVDPLVHFDQLDWSHSLAPSVGIDPSFHLNQANQVGGPGQTPDRIPSLNFDPLQYLTANLDVAAAGIDPLRHFLQSGAAEGREPIAPTSLFAANGFDYVYYLQHNPDVAGAGVDPYLHFETVGWKEGRNPNALFDVKGYVANYADVAAAGVNPLDHYHQTGWHEGRDPSVNFDTTSYLAAYPDIAAAHVDPLLHYLQTGMHEGRSAFADGVWG